MNHHPIVLQQGIEPLAITEGRNAHEVVAHLRPRQANVIREFANQDEGRGPQFEITEVDAQKHGSKEKLDERQGEEGAVFPGFGGPNQDPTQDHMPGQPKEETAFLAFPKTGGNVLHGHIQRAVAPYIVKFEPMIKQGNKKHRNRTQHPDGMQSVGPACGSADAQGRAFFSLLRGPKRLNSIKKSGDQSARKREGDEKAAQEGPKAVFAEVMH